jgi:hypothetical protein
VDAPDGSLAAPHGAQEEVNTLYILPNNNSNDDDDNNNNNNNNNTGRCVMLSSNQYTVHSYIGLVESAFLRFEIIFLALQLGSDYYKC